jgi:hypothetical protein
VEQGELAEVPTEENTVVAPLGLLQAQSPGPAALQLSDFLAQQFAQ